MAYYRSVGNDKSLLKVSDLEKMIGQRQNELIQMNETKKKLYKKADFRAKSLIFLGSSIFIG